MKQFFQIHLVFKSTLFDSGLSGPSKETVVPGAIIYNDMSALVEMSKVHSAGSLAFILDEQALLVRVRGGWQYVSVSIKP